ncbi:UNVERIFIED_CONTAM: hypothetical protein K2H54_047266 [Gekko kuhli]
MAAATTASSQVAWAWPATVEEEAQGLLSTCAYTNTQPGAPAAATPPQMPPWVAAAVEEELLARPTLEMTPVLGSAAMAAAIAADEPWAPVVLTREEVLAHPASVTTEALRRVVAHQKIIQHTVFGQLFSTGAPVIAYRLEEVATKKFKTTFF